MKKNSKWLSLVISISISLIMGLLALYILEYMIPFSKNTKNIEHSVSAYYMADSAIEDSLYSIIWKKLIFEKTDTLDMTKARDYSISMNAKWKSLPTPWEWNSEFNKNYNRIKIWEPIQLEIWDNMITNISNFKLNFRVPKININSSTTLSWWELKIINWQLSWNNNILNAYNTQIAYEDIWSTISLDDKQWRKLDDTVESFWDFYSNNCGSWNSCILKMSVINKLELSDSTIIPYLEWNIKLDQEIPLRYRVIDTIWRSYWFRKTLRIKIAQQTVNEAYDFAVFQ